MRKLMRILVGVAMLASLALVVPPAHANHGGVTVGVDKNWPPQPDTVPTSHENPPVAPENLVPAALCGVAGTVRVPTRTDGGPQHWLNFGTPPGSDPPFQAPDTTVKKKGPDVEADPITANLWNNPSHSHYFFEGVLILCVGPGIPGGVVLLNVEARGGNDGHYFNIYNNPLLNGCSIALPLVDDKKNSDKKDEDTDPCIPPALGDLHDKNEHHGSVNESAWSHGSLFKNNYDKACAVPWAGGTQNKGLITATEILGPTVDAIGWVKYIRVGPAVRAWGNFTCGTLLGAGVNAFTANLAFSPFVPDTCDATDPKKPDPTEVQPNSCFALAGVATLHADHEKNTAKP